MTPMPEVRPLPYKQRQFVFITALVIFCAAVPLLVFYAIGYRFDFNDELSSIKSVGGMYVTSQVQNVEMYIDNKPVQDMRIFQSAAYIQNLEAGSHQIHVQGPDVYTWVKELPVFSHFVTEAQSFNMPLRPQIRFITPYKDTSGLPVLLGAASTTPLFVFASSTPVFFAATSSATSTYIANPEFAYTQSLFASSSENAIALLEQNERLAVGRFTFGELPATSTVLIESTTTKMYQDTVLFQDGDDVYMQWVGEENAIPYYYCVRYSGASTTAALYGDHVNINLQGVLATVISATATTDTELQGGRYCRTTIRIDRRNSEVLWFDYFPDSRDLVLIHLSDGLYVVEVDDRAWQNTQLLYPGNDIEVLLDGGQILIKDGEYYIEVFTEVLL